MGWRARVFVTPKQGVLDPQGKAVQHSLHTLGYPEVADVRIGKFIELSIDVANKRDAEEVTRNVCQKLLANPVMEDYTFVIEEVKKG